MSGFVVVVIIGIALYLINKAWQSLTGRVEDHQRVKGAQRTSIMRENARIRNQQRPQRMREEAEHNVRNTWLPSIRREEQRAQSAWVKVAKQMASGKDPGRAASRAAKHERGAATLKGSMNKELGQVGSRYGDSPTKYGPRVHPLTGKTLPGIRRPGHEHPGVNAPAPKVKPKKSGGGLGGAIKKRLM